MGPGGGDLSPPVTPTITPSGDLQQAESAPAGTARGAIKDWAGDMVEGTQALMANKPIQTAIDYYKPGAKKAADAAGDWLGDMWEGTKGLLNPEALRRLLKDYITGGPERQAGIEQSATGAGIKAGQTTRRGAEAVGRGAQAVGRGAKLAGETALEGVQDVAAGVTGAGKGFYKGFTDPDQQPLPQPSRPQVGVNPDIYGDVTARQGASPINELMVPPPESRETQDAMAPGWHAPMARDYIPPPEPGYRGQLSQPFTEEEMADLWDKKQAILREGPYSADHRDYTGHYRQKADSVRQAQKPFWKFWSRMFDW
jgi:hypothetical protein